LPTFRPLPLLLFPLVLSLGACRVERNPIPEVLNVDSAARVDIRATMAAYRAALLENDARAVASHFTADAEVYEPGAGDVIGSGAVFESFDGFFGNGGAITDLELESESIHVDGGVAFELGRFAETSRTADAEQTVRGRYMIRWRRGEEARWRIDRFLMNHYPQDTAVARPTEAGVLPGS
jgi:ketosteroid isomerase-like protein